MSRESSMKPAYQILAYLTSDRDRVISGGPLLLYSDNLEELKQMTVDIAKGMKADVVQMTNGDYLVIRV
ncbi:capping complex subunit for YIEGIA [Rossellomorea sp. NPDC077527]|uniref:capping complex subunit for YIEGIA n=1 Tax=Rossellomorea sp. NPDC077527 TaxID=3364510 RepID=UPI0037CA325A